MSLSHGGPYPVGRVQEALNPILESAYKEHYRALVDDLRNNYIQAEKNYALRIYETAGPALFRVLPSDVSMNRHITLRRDPDPEIYDILDFLVVGAAGTYPSDDWADKQAARFKFYYAAAIRHSEEAKAADRISRRRAAETHYPAATSKSRLPWTAIAVGALALAVIVLAVVIAAK